MRFITTLAAAGVIALATPAFSQQLPADQFVAMAASSDQFEIQSSEAVLAKGQSDDVKEFAQMMVKDHGAASQKLMSAAQAAGMTPPTRMMEKHAAQLQSLEGLEGTELDRAYVEAQVAAHKEALALMQGYAKSGDQEPLRAHAETTAPVIAQHLEHVQKMAAQ